VNNLSGEATEGGEAPDVSGWEEVSVSHTHYIALPSEPKSLWSVRLVQ